MEGFDEVVERAVLAWAVDGLAPDDALERARRHVAETGVACAIVDLPVASRAPSPPSSFDRIAAHAAARRLLSTIRDPGFAALVDAEDCARSQARWLAAEPVEDAGVAVATWVVLGDDDAPKHELLVALPRLAALCAPLVRARRAKEAASRRRHAMNNLLAAASANMGYVADLLEEGVTTAGAPDEVVTDLVKAVANTRQAIQDLAAHVEAVTRV